MTAGSARRLHAPASSRENVADAAGRTASDAMHVVARVGDERFAFRVADVEEVIDAPPLIAVPNAPPGLAGQFTHRERTISAYDAAWAFGVARRGGAGTALVLRVAGDRSALIVDDVDDLASLDPDAVRSTPVGADPSGLLRGVCLPRPGAAHSGELIGVVNAVALVARVAARAVVAP